MTRIGFIDYFLDEWHANNYPEWIAKEGHGRFAVVAAYADIDSPDGLTNAQWCEQKGIRHSPSIEDLVESTDGIVVLSPDHPEHHFRLSQLPLRSGKPVYIDKTFAPDAATAIELFRIADESGTPLYSTSALRYAVEFETQKLDTYSSAEYVALATRGPGNFDNYSIHQLEMIVRTMGPGAVSAAAVGSTKSPCIVFDYGNDRSVLLHCIGDTFTLSAVRDSGATSVAVVTENFWPGFIRDLLGFFDSRKPPVPKEETIAAVAMYEAGLKALRAPYSRIEL